MFKDKKTLLFGGTVFFLTTDFICTCVLAQGNPLTLAVPLGVLILELTFTYLEKSSE